MAKDIKKFNVKRGDDLTNIKPGKDPYSRPGSENFFMNVKKGKVENVRRALIEDRFLVF